MSVNQKSRSSLTGCFLFRVSYEITVKKLAKFAVMLGLTGAGSSTSELTQSIVFGSLVPCHMDFGIGCLGDS